MKATVDRPYQKVEVHVAGCSQTARNSNGTTPTAGVTRATPFRSPFLSPNPNELDKENSGSDPNPEKIPHNKESTVFRREKLEEKIREIDKEMGFLNENLVGLNVKDTPRSARAPNPVLKVVNPEFENRGPLKDISNAQTTKRVGSWKKKARAQVSGSSLPKVVLAKKRNCEVMMEVIDSSGRPDKVLKTKLVEIFSTKVNVQPR